MSVGLMTHRTAPQVSRHQEAFDDHGPPAPKEDAVTTDEVGSSGSSGVERAQSTRINSSATKTAAKMIVRSTEGPVTGRTR